MINRVYLLTYPDASKNDDNDLAKGSGHRMTEEKSGSDVPQALEPPIVLGGDIHQYEAWKGTTTFRRKGKETPGEAKVFLDLMPVPEFRFQFTPETKPAPKDVSFDSPLGDGVIGCGPPTGAISCRVTNSEFSSRLFWRRSDTGE